MRSFTNLVWKPFGGAEPHRPMTFLEIFSSKKFSRVVVYCSVIKVPVVLSSRQLWYFIKSLSLCQELFYFSFFSLPSLTSQLSYITISVYCLSTVFYIFFKFFKPLQNLVYSLDIIHNFTSNIQKLPDLSSSFPDNIKRRRRDLNPRAATNDLLPFQGSPFGQLGYFSKTSGI